MRNTTVIQNICNPKALSRWIEINIYNPSILSINHKIQFPTKYINKQSPVNFYMLPKHFIMPSYLSEFILFP